MSTDVATLPQVLTYKKVLAGTQPAEVVDKILDGQTFSVQYQPSDDGQTLTLTTEAEQNFVVSAAIELPLHTAVGVQYYGTTTPFSATVFGQEYQVTGLLVDRVVFGTTEIWHSAMQFQDAALVGTGPEAGPLVERLRG